MHDTITINIPFLDEFVILTDRDKDLYRLSHDVDFFGVKGFGEFIRDLETGKVWFEDVKHPFDSIPSDYSNLVLKIYHKTRNCKPYIMLQGSPKILQGHNVFYIDDVYPLVSTMLGMLLKCHPFLFSVLDVREAHFSRIDATYSVRLEHERLVKPVNDMFGKISIGQRKPDEKRNIHYNTNYWNSAGSRLGYCKSYGKFNDLEKDINKHKRSMKTNVLSNKLYYVLTNKRLIDYASGLLRLEATCKKELLNKLNIPSNVWDFINYQRRNPKVLEDIWSYWFTPLFNALEGSEMTDIITDVDIYKKTRKLFTYKVKQLNFIYSRSYYYYDTESYIIYGQSLFVFNDYKNSLPYDYKLMVKQKYSLLGRVSWTIANNAYDFYMSIKTRGWDEIKKLYHKTRFSRALKNLKSIGLSQSFLMTLHTENKAIILLADVIHVRFDNQQPDCYVPPASVYDFDAYLRPKLRLVV